MVALSTRAHAWLGRIAAAAGILCVACCALPVIGLAIGSAALIGLAVYAERAVWVFAAIGLVAFAIRRYAHRDAPACDLDCSARPSAPPRH